MITLQEFNEIKEKVFDLLKVKTEIKTEMEEYEGISVLLENGTAKIGGTVKSDFYRGFMQLSLAIKRGENSFELKEKRHFETLGLSIDMSRNGVMKVERVKEIIDVLALCGFNYIQLYMEDVFDLPGYPYFGYRRGKYSHAELKEIDDYAYKMGIEAVPSIQTLGHLSQYLRYSEAAAFRENGSVLLCGEEKTYEFIEAIIKTMRSCFRTNRISINCDEAGGIGNRQMRREKKWQNSYEIVMKHVDRVMEICKKYDFKSYVCGDLFYSHLAKGYYDFEFEGATEEERKLIPDIDIAYWDYYHTEEEHYDKLIKGHLSFGRNVIFWGGIWLWCGQLPQVDFTFRTMEPALKSCLKNGITDIWASVYEDDGCETNINFVIPQLLIYSENCFKGMEYKTEDVYKLSKELFNVDMDEFRALSEYHKPWLEGMPVELYAFPVYMGKKILYSDILYNMTGTYDFSKILPAHEKALEKIKDAGKGTFWEEYYDYGRLLYEITIEKMKLMPALRELYKADKLDELKEIAEKRIPVLTEKYIKLKELHEKQWLFTYKPFGLEEIQLRYAATITRLEYASRILLMYINKEVESIPELEYDFIESKEKVFNFSQLKSVGL